MYPPWRLQRPRLRCAVLTRNRVARISERGGLPGCGGGEAPGGEPARALRMEEEVFEGTGPAGDDREAEIRRLKRELARVTEERDILKRPPRTLPRVRRELAIGSRAAPNK